MIEINLLPGAKRRRKGPGLSLSLPQLPALGNLDRWTAGIVAAWLLAPAAFGWMFFGARSTRDALQMELDQAVADSSRYASVIKTMDRLRARQDTVARKLEVIQQIDAGRYTWSHIMDEVSRALPDYTWLVELAQTEGGAHPTFQMSGRTGNQYALTRFMRDLEGSPFIRGVRLASSELVQENGKLIYAFVIEAGYEDPPPDLIQTVPLFVEEE